MGLRAVVMYPSGSESAHWLDAISAHCQQRDYDVIAVIGDLKDWEEALDYVTSGRAEVIVAPENKLDPDRVPRLETVSDRPPPPDPRHERTRPIRRDGEA